MRGARDHAAAPAAAGELPGAGMDELTGILREIASEVRALRSALPTPREDDHA